MTPADTNDLRDRLADAREKLAVLEGSREYETGLEGVPLPESRRRELLELTEDAEKAVEQAMRALGRRIRRVEG